MAKTTTIPLAVRDIYSHVLQLCDYVEDMRGVPHVNDTYDYGVLRAKANQVKTLIMEKSQ